MDDSSLCSADWQKSDGDRLSDRSETDARGPEKLWPCGNVLSVTSAPRLAAKPRYQ